MAIINLPSVVLDACGRSAVRFLTGSASAILYRFLSGSPNFSCAGSRRLPKPWRKAPICQPLRAFCDEDYFSTALTKRRETSSTAAIGAYVRFGRSERRALEFASNKIPKRTLKIRMLLA
jgi:hypothetical protein